MQPSHRQDGPVALDAPLDYTQVARHRNITCGRYNLCLEVVVRRKWISFSCSLCSLARRRFDDHDHQGAGRVLLLPLLEADESLLLT